MAEKEEKLEIQSITSFYIKIFITSFSNLLFLPWNFILSLLFLLYCFNFLSLFLSLALLFIPEIPSSMEKCSFVGRIHPRIANSEPFLRIWKFL